MWQRNRSFEGAPSRRALLGAGVVAALLGTLDVRTAPAQSSRLLDGPRAAGTVGEGFDGFAVARGATTPDLSKLIDQVNAERRAVYLQQAQKTGAPVAAVGKIYAGEIMKSAPAGTWFLNENGQWTRK
jgi:uncharacterized protein YdbL (DUF1318 family)